MKIGDSYSESFIITQEEVNVFASISGDKNPLHIDADYASQSIFKKRIVHGFLAGSRFSKILGMNFPGEGTIYLSQEMKFIKPMFVGVEYIAELKILEIKEEKKRLIVETTIIESDTKEKTIIGKALVQNNQLQL